MLWAASGALGWLTFPTANTMPQFVGGSPLLWAGGLAVVIAIALAILERVHPKQLDSAQ